MNIPDIPDDIANPVHHQPDNAAHPDLLGDGQHHPSADLLGDGQHHPSPDLLGDGQHHPSADLLGDGQHHPSADLLGDGQHHPSPDLLGDGQHHPSPDLLGDGQHHPSPDLLGDGQPHPASPYDLADVSGPLADNIPGTNIRLDPGDIPPRQSHVVIDQEGKQVTVIPEVTIYGQPQSTGAGASFASPDDAARAALAEIDTKSVDDNVEYAGNIYQNKDGSYSFSGPVTLGSNSESDPRHSPIPAGATRVATYHSHAGGFHPSDEFFSGTDKWKAIGAKNSSYLVTPMGQLLKYTPPDLLPSSQQQAYPGGLVTRVD